MVGESDQNEFLIHIDASKFAEFEISEFDISRFDCFERIQKAPTGHLNTSTNILPYIVTELQMQTQTKAERPYLFINLGTINLFSLFAVNWSDYERCQHLSDYSSEVSLFS